MSAGHNGWRALPLHLRPLARCMWALEKLGITPTVQEFASSPLAERQKIKPRRRSCRPAPAEVEHHDLSVPTRWAGSVSARVYRPESAPGPLPVVLYFHGGAWIGGCVDGADEICRRLALAAAVSVVSVDYRLAPAHRFPAGLQDCADALAWVRKTGAQGGFDAARVAVAGDSAGGNLAAALCLADRGAPVPLKAQVLFYPALDATVSSDYVTGFRGPGLTQAQCREIVEIYVGAGHNRRDPLVSPVHAPDLSGLPAALVVTGGADILADDGHRYVERLLTAGVPAELLHYPRAPHAFLGLDRLLPEAREAIDRAAGFLSQRLDTKPTLLV